MSNIRRSLALIASLGSSVLILGVLPIAAYADTSSLAGSTTTTVQDTTATTQQTVETTTDAASDTTSGTTDTISGTTSDVAGTVSGSTSDMTGAVSESTSGVTSTVGDSASGTISGGTGSGTTGETVGVQERPGASITPGGGSANPSPGSTEITGPTVRPAPAAFEIPSASLISSADGGSASGNTTAGLGKVIPKAVAPFLGGVPPFASGIGLVTALIAAAVFAVFTFSVFAARGVVLSGEVRSTATEL